MTSGAWRVAALAGALAFLAGALAPAPDGIRVSPLDSYGEAVADGSIPYRDFSLEYPPGALPPIVLPALIPAVSYAAAFRALQALLGVLLVVCTAYLLRDARRVELLAGVALVALLPILLGRVVVFRFDLWPALLVSASLLALERRRVGAAGALLGVATAAKLYGAVLVPPLLAFANGRRRRLRVAAAVVVAGLAVTLPLAVAAPGGVASSLERQLDRPLQIETLGASLLLAVGSPEVEFASGSWSLRGPEADAVGVVSSALALLLLAAVWALVWRYPGRVGAPPLTYALCVALVLVLGRVASPQFLVWLVPLVALVRGRHGLAACALVGGACVLTQLVYPARYESLVADQAWPVALLVARNVLLVATVAVLGAALVRRLGPPLSAARSREG